MDHDRWPLRALVLACFLFFLASLLFPCTPVVRLGRQGETILNNRIQEPLPAGSTVRFMPAGHLIVSNERNPTGSSLVFDVMVSATAPLGGYLAQCRLGTGEIAAETPDAFTVFPAQPTPTPTPTATSPGPTPTPTATSPGPTPTPPATPTRPGPLPTPLEGTLRIAPDTITEGARLVRYIIAGANFSSSTTVMTPADIRLERMNVLSPTRLEILLSNRLGTPSGPRVFFVATPGFPSGTVVVTVIPARSLAAPLSVSTAAIVFPRRGTFVAAGERLFARGLLAVTGSGAITGSWKLDGVPFERFEVYASGGEPMPVESKVPIPEVPAGDHFLELEVDHPQSIVSERVLILGVARRGAQMRVVEPGDGAVAAEPRVFRWTVVPGAQAYEIVFSSEAEELPDSTRFRISGGIWTPTPAQWKQIGEGTRFWAVRAIFPVDVRGPLTAWQRIVITPAQVFLKLSPPVYERDSGAVTLSWRGGSPGLLYRVVFRDSPETEPLFSALTFRSDYSLARTLIRGSPARLSYRVEAVVPGGASRGATPVAQLELQDHPPPGKLVSAAAVSIRSHDPPDGGAWSPATPAIVARWSGKVEASEVLLLVGSTDVTPLTDREPGAIRYVPPLPLGAGPHRILLKLGEKVSRWEVRGPSLSLAAATQAERAPPRAPPMRAPLEDDPEADRNLEWKVEASGIVTVKSDAGDTAHLTVSSAASFFRENAWSLEESIELAGHHDFKPRHTVQDSRSWLVRAGVGDEERWRADGLVGYSPPDSVEGLQLLTAGFARGGAEARAATPLGKFSGYATFDDTLSGLFTSTYAGSQQIRLGAYEAPLPSDRFLLRGLYLEVEEEGSRGSFVSPSTGKAYGGIARWQASRAFALTFEGARTKLEDESREDLAGNAFRINLQGTGKRTNYVLNLHQTDAEFLNLANQALTAAGQPNRRGGDLGLSHTFGKLVAGVAYRYLQSESDPADAESQAGNLTLTLSLSKKVKATATGLWSLDTGDSAAGARGPLPRLDREQRGGRLLLTETLGRFSLSQTFSWNELDDKVSANNDVETTGVNLIANGNLARTLALNLSVGATRSDRALSGHNDNLTVLLQPRWTVPSLRLSLTPRASYSYSASDASPVTARSENYQALLSWTVFRGKVQPILGASAEWFRTRAGRSSPSDFDHRYVGTLTIRWGSGGPGAGRAAGWEDPPAAIPTAFRASLSPEEALQSSQYRKEKRR